MLGVISCPKLRPPHRYSQQGVLILEGSYKESISIPAFEKSASVPSLIYVWPSSFFLNEL
eukprot:COSAG06_NODE_36911_length_441_cov_1.345029_1_plen_59_part_01